MHLRSAFTAAVLAGTALTAAATPAAAAPPVTGTCPPGYQHVTVDYVVQGAGLSEPDPSMDPNGNGYTCLKLLDTGSGTRATWHDDVSSVPQ
jgi:hypothetical protein